MTRTIALFEDGTALVGSIEADALGSRGDLPFLSDNARVAAARAALANDDWSAAEATSARSVVSPSDDDVVHVTFIAPPDWVSFGPSLWEPVAGVAHAVFQSSVMLVDGVAVIGCVGLPFENETARRDCAAWCLKNGLDDIALNVSRTPVGGAGPYCTWPDTDLVAVSVDQEPQRCAETQTTEALATETDNDLPDRPVDAPEQTTINVVSLFGDVFGIQDL
ncbi:hypothetical protein [Sulfitobacter sp.]|uniref:hypothetical protein n=1 Tax=Sulfitobacter sp. TaxID=1903071 RepID=UPI0030018884